MKTLLQGKDYTPSHLTDVRKTIRKELRRLKAEQERREALPDSEGRVIRMRAIARRAG